MKRHGKLESGYVNYSKKRNVVEYRQRISPLNKKENIKHIKHIKHHEK